MAPAHTELGQFIEILQALDDDPDASLERLSDVLRVSRYRVRDLIRQLELVDAITTSRVGRKFRRTVNVGNYIDGLLIAGLISRDVSLNGAVRPAKTYTVYSGVKKKRDT